MTFIFAAPEEVSIIVPETFWVLPSGLAVALFAVSIFTTAGLSALAANKKGIVSILVAILALVALGATIFFPIYNVQSMKRESEWYRTVSELMGDKIEISALKRGEVFKLARSNSVTDITIGSGSPKSVNLKIDGRAITYTPPAPPKKSEAKVGFEKSLEKLCEKAILEEDAELIYVCSEAL